MDQYHNSNFVEMFFGRTSLEISRIQLCEELVGYTFAQIEVLSRQFRHQGRESWPRGTPKQK